MVRKRTSNPRVGFIAEIERCVTAAAERSMTYPAVYKNVRRVIAKRFPFSVYFRAEAHRIVVLARDLAAPDLANDEARPFRRLAEDVSTLESQNNSPFFGRTE